MNTDRIQLSVALLISIAVHGAIASFGDFPSGQAAIAAPNLPVALTVAPMTKTEIRQPMKTATLTEPLQQPPLPEMKLDGAEAAETDMKVDTDSAHRGQFVPR